MPSQEAASRSVRDGKACPLEPNLVGRKAFARSNASRVVKRSGCWAKMCSAIPSHRTPLPSRSAPAGLLAGAPCRPPSRIEVCLAVVAQCRALFLRRWPEAAPGFMGEHLELQLLSGTLLERWAAHLQREEYLPPSIRRKVAVHMAFAGEEFKPRTIWSLSNVFASVFKELDPIPRF